jgi:hypothetical protein
MFFPPWLRYRKATHRPRRRLPARQVLLVERLEDRALPSLVGYWPFDGTGSDASGFGRDMTLTSGAGYTTGLLGQALDLHNNDASARRPVDDAVYDFGASDFTVQVWVNFRDTSREQTLVEKFSDTNGPGWTLTKSPDNSFEFYAAPSADLTSGIQTIATGVWHHLLVRRSGTNFKMFFDGKSIATQRNSTPITDTTYPLLVGKRNETDGRPFDVDGRIDEVAIWSQALSNAQISSLYNNGAGSTAASVPTGLIGYWPFDGTPADASGGHRDLNLTNNPGFAAGLFGQSLDLHYGEYATRPASEPFFDFAGQPFSLQAWIKMTPGDEKGAVILAKHESGHLNGYFLFANKHNPNQGQLDKAGFYASSPIGNDAISTTSVNDGQWHQIVGVYTPSGNSQIYVDGVLQGSQTAQPLFNNLVPLTVGALPNGSLYFNGQIDEVAVWDQALSATDIAALYNGGAGKSLLTLAPGPAAAPAAAAAAPAPAARRVTNSGPARDLSFAPTPVPAAPGLRDIPRTLTAAGGISRRDAVGPAVMVTDRRKAESANSSPDTTGPRKRVDGTWGTASMKAKPHDLLDGVFATLTDGLD